MLLRAGIAEGLRREAEAEREPVEVDAAPDAREDTSWTVLTEAGFQLLVPEDLASIVFYYSCT